MYYRHFNLSGPPFEAASSPEALYLSRAHRESLAALEWGLLHEPSGFTTLTGETGTGKTTLVCSMLARNFSQLCAAYVVNPKLSFEDILRVVLGQFGVACEGTTKLDRIEALVGHLGRRMPHERLAIIVDEAQDLSDDALEELRLLSNYGQRVGRYLQLVLVAQPELAARLNTPKLRQFNQRVAARSILGRLTFHEAHEYVGYRLRAKGGRSRDVFESNALAYLLRHSCGIPRQINVLCHNAMLTAYSSGSTQVTIKHARAAVTEHGQSLLGWSAAVGNPLQGAQPILVAGGALALLVAVAYGYHGASSESVRVTSAPPLKTEAESTGPQIASRSPAETKKVSLKVEPPAGTSATPTRDNKSSPQPIRTLAAASDPGSENTQAKNEDPITLPPLSTSDSLMSQQKTGAQRMQAESKLPPQAPEADGRRSVSVKYGDTLEKLAQKYFGSKYALNVLIDANPQITDINKIYPGQKVYLSASTDAGPGADSSAPRISSRHAANADDVLKPDNYGSSYAASNVSSEKR